jgi:hypothetical protein
MSSSTSSSDADLTVRPPPASGAWWKITLFLVSVVIALEVFTRGFLFPRSKDFVRFAGYPERAERLVQQPGLRLAFLGNSATERGLDPEVLKAQLPKAAKQPAAFDIFVADASMIETWYYMTKKYFWKEQRRPDWLIVHFFGPCLADGNHFEIGRAALFFTDMGDWQDLCELDLPTFGDRLDYLLSTRWATFAACDRIKSRTLGAVVPDYKAFAEELNAGQVRDQEKIASRSAPKAEAAKTYRALDRYLAEAARQRTPVCFVAFPTKAPPGKERYAVDPEALKRIEQAGMKYLDMREVPELKEEDYMDDLHLNPSGARIYTEKLVKAFFGEIERGGKGR